MDAAGAARGALAVPDGTATSNNDGEYTTIDQPPLSTSYILHTNEAEHIDVQCLSRVM
jgi:hypothetical protein